MKTEIKNLDQLFTVMKLNPETINGLRWDELPNFGGEWPLDTAGVWSWDEKRMIVGQCASDLKIVSREVES